MAIMQIFRTITISAKQKEGAQINEKEIDREINVDVVEKEKKHLALEPDGKK